MDTRYAISNYPDARKVNQELTELINKPITSISPEALERYEKEYFDKKCAKSKAMIEEAKQLIPGGVQHNLAFNHPFPLVFTKAQGAYLYDIDGNQYYDFLQAGGPTVLGSNPEYVRNKVIELLNDCGPSTGLFHEFEYKLAKKISENFPTVEMLECLDREPRHVWQPFVLQDLLRARRILLRWVEHIMVGVTSWHTVSVFRGPNGHRHMVYRTSASAILRSSSRMI
jgi:hypothetical protein